MPHEIPIDPFPRAALVNLKHLYHHLWTEIVVKYVKESSKLYIECVSCPVSISEKPRLIGIRYNDQQVTATARREKNPISTQQKLAFAFVKSKGIFLGKSIRKASTKFPKCSMGREYLPTFPLVHVAIFHLMQVNNPCMEHLGSISIVNLHIKKGHAPFKGPFSS